MIYLSIENDLWSHLAKTGILPCNDRSTIETDLSEHPWVVHSFSFDCITLNDIIFRDVHATVDINGVSEITFTGFDSPGHVDLSSALVNLDEMEGNLRERLRSFTENNDDLA